MDKTRIAVLTDEGWVEGVVEYAQVVKGKGWKRHTAYHVNVEFPDGMVDCGPRRAIVG